MVMEKSWEHEKLDKSHRILISVIKLFATNKKLSIYVESSHFLTFSAKHCYCKIYERDGHGKVMGKICRQVCGNREMVIE